jgi:hypothetical protein
MVSCVSNDYVVAAVYGHACRKVERRVNAIAVRKHARPVSRERDHHTVWCDFADAVVHMVCNNDVTAAVHGHAGR